jgi:hypothetical protein
MIIFFYTGKKLIWPTKHSMDLYLALKLKLIKQIIKID